MRENYANASEMVRNIAQIPGHEVLETRGEFRIVRLPPPFVEGAELWVVNEKGFLWQPVADIESGRDYIECCISE